MGWRCKLSTGANIQTFHLLQSLISQRAYLSKAVEVIILLIMSQDDNTPEEQKLLLCFEKVFECKMPHCYSFF
jgi:hypothetical protein